MRDTILDCIYEALPGLQSDIVLPPRAQLAVTPWRATNLDSLGIQEMSMMLEETFQCELTNDMLQHIRTFGDLAAVVAAQAVREDV